MTYSCIKSKPQCLDLSFGANPHIKSKWIDTIDYCLLQLFSEDQKIRSTMRIIIICISIVELEWKMKELKFERTGLWRNFIAKNFRIENFSCPRTSTIGGISTHSSIMCFFLWKINYVYIHKYKTWILNTPVKFHYSQCSNPCWTIQLWTVYWFLENTSVHDTANQATQLKKYIT